MSTSPLRALSCIISAGIESIEAAYASHDASFPSLDDPVRPDSLNDPELMQSTAAVVAAASQLIATVRTPLIHLMDMGCGMHSTAALQVTNELNLVEILREAGPKGLHVKEIGQRANTDPDKISRILRYLAARHVFREVAPEVFANNKLSSLLDTGKSHAALVANPKGKLMNTAEVSPAACFVSLLGIMSRGDAALAEWIIDPVKASSEESKDCPLMEAHTNSSKVLYEWLEEPGNEQRLQTFHIAMAAQGAMNPMDTIVQAFDWASVPEDSIVVDVGGGIGSMTLAISKAFPHLKYVVQDREAVITEAKQFWEKHSPDALKHGRVLLQGRDFFNAQPVKGVSVFMLRSIIHNWSNKYCKLILTQLRDAAPQAAQLIIIDTIVPYATAAPETGSTVPGVELPKAPYPILSGYHELFTYNMDILMMVGLNGKERTIGDFIELGETTGWKLDRVVRGIGSHAHLVYVAA